MQQSTMFSVGLPLLVNANPLPYTYVPCPTCVDCVIDESEVAARGNKQMIDLIANKPENVKIVHVSRFGIKEIK